MSVRGHLLARFAPAILLFLWRRTAQTGCRDSPGRHVKHIPLGIPRPRGRPRTSRRARSTGPLGVFSGNNKAFLPHREPLVPAGNEVLYGGTVGHLNGRNSHCVILHGNPTCPDTFGVLRGEKHRTSDHVTRLKRVSANYKYPRCERKGRPVWMRPAARSVKRPFCR